MSSGRPSSPAGPSSHAGPSGNTENAGHTPSNNILSGFSLPDPSFNPFDNHVITAYSQAKEKGVLPDEDSIEADIEKEAERRVASWESETGRKATDEEYEHMMARIRRIRNGEWLQGLKTQLNGETQVSIAHFNHVVSENEELVRHVAKKSLERVVDRRERDMEIARLNEELQTLKEDQTIERNELNARIKQLETEYLTMQNELRAQIEELERDHAAEKEQLATRLAKLEEAHPKAQEDLEARIKELEKEISVHITEKKKLNQDIEELKKAHSAEKDQLAAKIAELKEVHSKAQDKLKARIDELEQQNSVVSSTRDKELKARIEELEKDYSTAQDELLKLEETNKKLGEDKAQAQKNLEKLEGDRDLLQTQLKEARDREERLQEENHKQETELQGCHRGRNVQDEKIQDLRDQLNEARAREKPLKDENRRLEDEVADLKRQLDEMATKGNGPANSPGSGSTNGPGSELGNGPGSGSDNGSGSGPGSGSGNEESDGTSDGSGNGNYQFDTVKLLRELKEAKATNGELSEESEELLAHWMARVADEHNLLEFYAAVADVRRDMGKLRRRVVAFYNSLGNDDTAIRAEDALANLEKQIGDQPGEALGARLWGLKLVAEKQMLETQLMTQVVRNDTLNVKLEMAKSDEQIDMEVRKDYGIYNEAEISKRVDSETQSFRVHRRELLSRIFDCANRFDVIALQCPHQPTQEAIRAASDEYLSPLNLPRPTFQEAR